MSTFPPGIASMHGFLRSYFSIVHFPIVSIHFSSFFTNPETHVFIIFVGWSHSRVKTLDQVASLQCFFLADFTIILNVLIRYKGAITSKIKHAIKLKTGPARLAQLLQAATVLLNALFYL